MRFAAIADIHGNAAALAAVLADIAALGTGEIVNLGYVPCDQMAMAELAGRNGRPVWASAGNGVDRLAVGRLARSA